MGKIQDKFKTTIAIVIKEKMTDKKKTVSDISDATSLFEGEIQDILDEGDYRITMDDYSEIAVALGQDLSFLLTEVGIRMRKPSAAVYFMHDNHLFTRLSVDADEAIVQINSILVSGQTYGTVITKAVDRSISLKDSKVLSEEQIKSIKDLYEVIKIQQEK